MGPQIKSTFLRLQVKWVAHFAWITETTKVGGVKYSHLANPPCDRTCQLKSDGRFA
jgi:hypothetical protein